MRIDHQKNSSFFECVIGCSFLISFPIYTRLSINVLRAWFCALFSCDKNFAWLVFHFSELQEIFTSRLDFYLKSTFPIGRILNSFRYKRPFQTFGENSGPTIRQKTSLWGSPIKISNKSMDFTSPRQKFRSETLGSRFLAIFGYQFWPTFSNGFL